jgi:hypothetical protein
MIALRGAIVLLKRKKNSVNSYEKTIKIPGIISKLDEHRLTSRILDARVVLFPVTYLNEALLLYRTQIDRPFVVHSA